MNLILRFSFSLLLAAFFSCGSSVVKKDKGTFTRFPAEKLLEETEFLKINSLSPDGLSLYADTVLFIRNTARSSKHHFSLFNLKSKGFLHSSLEVGRKPGQSLSFVSYGIANGYLWVYDVIKDKIILTRLDNVVRGKIDSANESPISTFYYAIQLLNDSTIIASGNYDADHKVFQLNLSTQQIEKQLAPYSTDPATPYSRAQKMAYESFLFLKPSNDKCVLACRYTDQIEIVDLSTQTSKIIKGPESFEPDVVIMKGNDGKELSTRGSDTRYAFVKGKVTNKFIYLLYSGNNHESEHLYYGKYIYVYDWNGNPVQKIKLKDYILDFVVTQDDSIIYTYNPDSKYIMTAKL